MSRRTCTPSAVGRTSGLRWLLQQVLASGCRFVQRPGAFLLVASLMLLPACEAPPLPGAGPSIDLNGETIRLERGASVVDIELQAVNGMVIEPDSVNVSPGDAVRFIAEDAATHAIVFDATNLEAVPQAFLARTNQLRGPPLVNPGSTWVISLESAPPGAYPFTCLTHGGGGVLIVEGEG
jgi:plastocyanin